MGLEMKVRHQLTDEIAQRYRGSGREAKDPGRVHRDDGIQPEIRDPSLV